MLDELQLLRGGDLIEPGAVGLRDGAADDLSRRRKSAEREEPIGRFAIEDQVITLEQAIRSSSGLPADILKLPERGYLKVGYFADIVVFDAKTFRDKATFDQPHQYSTGVRYLFVNGRLAIDEGKQTDALPGRALRHEK